METKLNFTGALCFMFPVRQRLRSGALLSALKIAKVAYDAGYKIKVIDYQDGFLKFLLNELDTEFEFVDLENKGWNLQVLSSDVVVGFNNDIYNYPYMFKNNPKVYFYDVLPSFWGRFLKPLNIPLPLKTSSFSKIYKAGLFKNALSFMEKASVATISQHFPDYCFKNIHYCPVSVELKGYKLTPEVPEKLRLTYIGRSEVWKLTPLARLLNDLKESDLQASIALKIVLSDISKGKKLLEQLVGPLSCFEITFFENLGETQLNEIILNSTDIGLGMGTSALEFSKLGIATILLDFSKKNISKKYRYLWIYQAQEGTIGLDLDDPRNGSRFNEGCSISDMLNDYIVNSRAIATMSYEHVLKNHNQHKNYILLASRAASSPVRANHLKTMISRFFHIMQSLRNRYIRGRSVYER